MPAIYSSITNHHIKYLMMKFGSPLSIVAVALFAFPVSVDATSAGAGGCAGGVAAVNGFHTMENGRTLTSGSLADGMVSLTVDSNAWEPGTTLDATPGTPYRIDATASGAPILGILFRVQCALDLDGSIQPVEDDEADLVTAALCEPLENVTGLTHMTATPKSQASIFFDFDTPVTASLDVTVVMANNDTHSIWYYSNYTINNRHPPCNICGTDNDGKLEPTALDVVVTLPVPIQNVTEISCDDANQVGLGGAVDAVNCALVPALFKAPCECEEIAEDVTPTMAPVMAPDTDSGSGIFFNLLGSTAALLTAAFVGI